MIDSKDPEDLSDEVKEVIKDDRRAKGSVRVGAKSGDPAPSDQLGWISDEKLEEYAKRHGKTVGELTAEDRKALQRELEENRES